MSGNVVVRDAREDDLPAILDIYNNAVLNETSIWNDDVTDLADCRAWWEARVARGFPVYVADVDGAVAGYGTFGEFRANQGYRFTVEHSIYVATPAQRRGIGSVLLTRLIAEARRLNMRHGRRHRRGQRRFDRALHLRFRFVVNGRDAASRLQVRPLARPCPLCRSCWIEP